MATTLHWLHVGELITYTMRMYTGDTLLLPLDKSKSDFSDNLINSTSVRDSVDIDY